MDIASTVIPDSTQVNADDLIASDVTVTITGVNKGNAEQPVNIELAEFPGRAYRPGKSMRRVLIAAWGTEASAYVGRRLTLYRDPEISFGREKTGGIRISHMSHIDKPLSIALTVTRGRRAPFVVQPLTDAPNVSSGPPVDPADALIANYTSQFNVTRQQLEAHVALPVDEWTPQTLDALRVLGGELASGAKNVADEFGGSDE